ncbi:MAG: precorrin-3B C(17)-methyltransferase [Proteobacteria bacterium]|nr:precorrin-3B C(17)-methyltransferase [Pseudomonadota bacterium]
MARVSRLAGAMLAETRGRYFLIGNTKEPCDWPAAGFAPPGEIDAATRPFVELTPQGPVELDGYSLHFELEGEELASELARRMLIERNGSVSERLWRLVCADRSGHGDEYDDYEVPETGVGNARWLTEMPARVWDIVRDSVLRCT